MVIYQIHIPIFRISCKTVKICLHHIKIVLFCYLVKILIHRKRYIIIRFHNTDIFSRSFVQTDIHSLSITAIFLVNDHKTWIILRIFFNDFQRMICRSVVHTDNLYILQCLTLNTFQTFIQKHFHIICRYDN